MLNPEDNEFVEACEREFTNEDFFACQIKLIAIIRRQELALEKAVEQRDYFLSMGGHVPRMLADRDKANKELSEILGGW